MKWFARFLLLLPVFFTMGVSAQLTETKLTNPYNWAGFKFGSEVFIHNDFAFVSSELLSTANGGRVWVYQRNGDDWLEVDEVVGEKLMCTSTTTNTHFGYALSGNDDFLMVGAPYWSANCAGDDDDYAQKGAVFMYKKSGTEWQETQKLWDPETNLYETEQFGREVDMDGNRAVVGAYGRNIPTVGEAGAAHVYAYNEASGLWVKQAFLQGTENGQRFGSGVGVSGDWIIIGATERYITGGGKGFANLYHFEENSWVQKQQLYDNSLSNSDQFGNTVAIAGDYAIVGAVNHHKVNVYKRNDLDVWEHVQTLEEAHSIRYGQSLDIKGNHIIIGDESYFNSPYTGAAFIYELNESTGSWDLLDAIYTDAASNYSSFGYRVSIDEGRAIVGAYSYKILPAENVGAAYVYGDFGGDGSIVADFDFDPMLALVNTNISFTDQSTAEGTAITSWSWDFDNDGEEDSNLQNPTYQWATEGAHKVTLTVSDGTISSTASNWVTLLSADAGPCLSYIPFAGNENDHRGAAAWNADGAGPEPAKTGHGTPAPASTALAYYYLASRDYSNIDPASSEGIVGNGDAVNWPALTEALANHGKTTADLEISFGLMTLGDDIEGQDWEMVDNYEWRKYTGGTFSIKLDGEQMLGGDMPSFTMDIYYHEWEGSRDDIKGETAFAPVEDLSAGSSDAAQAIAAAFIQDCSSQPIQFFFSSMQSALQMDFDGNGRDGGYFNVDQGFIMKVCGCELTATACDDKTLNPNEQALLSVTAENGEEPYTYLWSPAEGLDDATSAMPAVQIDETRTYTVTVSDAEGCFAEDSVVVTILEMGQLMGTITDIYSGEAIQDAQVELIGLTNATTSTTFDGTYQFNHIIPDNNYQVRITKNDYTTHLEENVAIVGLETTTLNIAITSISNLEGTITDAVALDGVEGCLISIVGTALTTYSDWEGNFTIENVPPGTYDVQFTHDAFVDKTKSDVVFTLGHTTNLIETLNPIIYTWTGTENTIWDNANNWSNYPIPQSVHITIPEVASGNYPVYNSAEFYACKNLTIKPNARFTLTGEGHFEVWHDLFIEANASGRGSFVYTENLNILNIAHIQQYISGTGLAPGNRQWHYLTPMLSSTHASTFEGFLVNKYEEPTQTWAEIVNPEEELAAYLGISVCAPQNSVITQTGNFSVWLWSPMLTNTNPVGLDYTSGYNLTGNPHLAAADLEFAGNTLVDVDNTFSFWNPAANAGAGNYQYYTIGTGGTNGQTQYVQPGQGFFVKVADDAVDGTFGLSLSSLVHQDGNSFKETETPSSLRVKIHQDIYEDELLIRVGNNYNTDFSGKEDAHKLLVDNVAQIYALTSDDAKVAINAVNMENGALEIPVEVQTATSDPCRLSFELALDAGFKAVFEDRELSQSFDIENTFEYEYQAGLNDEGRFFIHLKSTTAVEETSETSIRAYYSNHFIHLQNDGAKTYQLLDVGGRYIMGGELQEKTGINNIPVDIPAGVYLMKLDVENKIVSQKLIIY